MFRCRFSAVLVTILTFFFLTGNVLILRGQFNLDTDSFEVSLEILLNRVAEILFDVII